MSLNKFGVVIFSIISIVSVAVFAEAVNSNTRECEMAGGVVMEYHNKPVCVSRQGLVLIPINP